MKKLVILAIAAIFITPNAFAGQTPAKVGDHIDELNDKKKSKKLLRFGTGNTFALDVKPGKYNPPAPPPPKGGGIKPPPKGGGIKPPPKPSITRTFGWWFGAAKSPVVDRNLGGGWRIDAQIPDPKPVWRVLGGWYTPKLVRTMNDPYRIIGPCGATTGWLTSFSINNSNPGVMGGYYDKTICGAKIHIMLTVGNYYGHIR